MHYTCLMSSIEVYPLMDKFLKCIQQWLHTVVMVWVLSNIMRTPPPPIPERNDTQDIKNMTFIGGFIAMLTHGCLPILVCSEDVAENYCNHLRTEISSNLCQNHAAL